MLAAVRPSGCKPGVEMVGGRCLTGPNPGNLLRPFGGKRWPEREGGRMTLMCFKI